MNSDIEHKKREIEYYSAKVSRRPSFGQQWDRRSWDFLVRLGNGGFAERKFRSLLRGKKCLIVGIGTGKDAVKLRKIVHEMVGIDISGKQLILLKAKNTKCNLVACDAEQMPFKRDTFTALVCRETLHHLPNINRGVTEIARVMRRGGVLVLHEPGLLNPLGLIARNLFPTNIHTPGEKPFILHHLKSILSRRFDIEEVTYFYIISLGLPVIFKYLRFIPKKVQDLLIFSLYSLERSLLTKTFLKHFSLSFFIIGKKK